jgi:hydroxymethylpyrimidine/phosphomethylpyrimidine kinase
MSTDSTPAHPPLNQVYPRVLSIAGSDSGGGAGIQADLKTAAALGCYGMTAITAITAQNTCGVSMIHAVPTEVLAAQIDAVADDIGVDAVKIGMLHAPEVVRVVAAAIRRHEWQHIVLDPVMVAASGDPLIAAETIAVLVAELFPLVSIITPNLDEAALLLGRPVRTVEDLEAAGQALLALGAPAVLLKGGHLADPTDTEVHDLLLQRHEPARHYRSPRIATRNIHGAGCTLSTALACQLALGASLNEAVQRARDYVHHAIAAGANVRIGAGHGPLDHGYAPHPQQRRALAL